MSYKEFTFECQNCFERVSTRAQVRVVTWKETPVIGHKGEEKLFCYQCVTKLGI